VQEGKIGAFQTEGPDSDGYYLVNWTSTQYRLEEARELMEYNPPIIVPKGGLVADAAYFNQVGHGPTLVQTSTHFYHSTPPTGDSC
jgi:hypothetical protein